MEQQVQTEQSVAQRNKAIVEQFQMEAFYKQNIDSLDQYLTPDFVDHLAPPWDPPGAEGIKKRFHQCSSSLTFLRVEVPVWQSVGDMLFQVVILHFRHTDEFMGIPATNKEFGIGGLDAFRIRDGKISEHWGVYDLMQIPALIGADVSAEQATTNGNGATSIWKT